MAEQCHGAQRIHGHPCFGGNHQRYGRIHLPVAPACNIRCRYCTRRHDCANESRPGVSSQIISPAEALGLVQQVTASPSLGQNIRVVGIAGPGDPLANEETFETLQRVGTEFPHLITCLSTNGLRLPDTIHLLHDIGLGSLTVTVNALNPAVGARIYAWVHYHGELYRGEAGAAQLISNQLAGIEAAAKLGITVKVNTVLIPGVNDGEVVDIAREVKRRGALIMNIMPVIPQAEFSEVIPPPPERLEELRRTAATTIGQFRHCQQCRADAVGLIGRDVADLGKGA